MIEFFKIENRLSAYIYIYIQRVQFSTLNKAAHETFLQLNAPLTNKK